MRGVMSKVEASSWYSHTPGIWRREEMEAWKPIVKAVHEKGALFVSQLWHVGRASHPDFQPDGGVPLGPSAIAIPAPFKAQTPSGLVDYPVPKEMTQQDISQRHSLRLLHYCKNACRGEIVETSAPSLYTRSRGVLSAPGMQWMRFDGVEIHEANGYPIEQFLCDSANKRTDKYGGCIENRCRLALEIVEAVTREIGAGRVGIRLAAHGTFLCPLDFSPYSTYSYLLERFNSLPEPFAFVDFIESRIV
ncbi:MAG: hypothetical protein WDW38_005401, partial [Sanguina aurantia]